MKEAVGKLEDAEKQLLLPLRDAWNGTVHFNTTMMTKPIEQDTEDFVFTHAAEHEFYLNFPSIDTKVSFSGTTHKRTPRNPTDPEDWVVGHGVCEGFTLSHMPDHINLWGLNQEYLEMKAEEVRAYVTVQLSKLEQFTLCNCSSDAKEIKQLHLACLFIYRGGHV